MNICRKCGGLGYFEWHKGTASQRSNCALCSGTGVHPDELAKLRAEVARLTKQLTTLRAALPGLCENFFQEGALIGYQGVKGDDAAWNIGNAYAELATLLSEDPEPPTTV